MAAARSRSRPTKPFSGTEILAQLAFGADLSGLGRVALMVDGAHFGEHCCVVGRARVGTELFSNLGGREQGPGR